MLVGSSVTIVAEGYVSDRRRNLHRSHAALQHTEDIAMTEVNVRMTPVSTMPASTPATSVTTMTRAPRIPATRASANTAGRRREHPARTVSSARSRTPATPRVRAWVVRTTPAWSGNVAWSSSICAVRQMRSGPALRPGPAPDGEERLARGGGRGSRSPPLLTLPITSLEHSARNTV